MLLRRRNKLRRAGKAEQNDIIAVKINKLIARNRSSALAAASNKDTRQLWALLKKTGNWGDKKQSIPNDDPNLINDHFASIASDSSYNREAVIKASLPGVHNAAKPCNDYYPADVIELLLVRIGRTSPGNDEIPYWLYRDCACEIAQIVTKLVNMSINLGVMPFAWRTAAITPVSKCMPAVCLAYGCYYHCT